MGKMIAVCGAPGSGKSTAALKIAEEIYYAKKRLGYIPFSRFECALSCVCISEL